MQEQRWIDFKDLEYADRTLDSDVPLDTNWVKLQIKIYPPKNIKFETDMEIEFCSRGKTGTKISVDLASLYQYNPILINNENVERLYIDVVEHKKSNTC